MRSTHTHPTRSVTGAPDPAPATVPGDRPAAATGGPALVRAGGIAGLLVPLPLLAAAAIDLAVGPNLRQFGFPWAAALAAASAGACTLALTAVHRPHWKRPLVSVGTVTAAGLLGVAGFFAALGAEDLLAGLAGTDRFLSDNDAVTALGTLVASILALLAVPIGLLVLGVATLRSGVLDRPGRVASVALTPLLLLAALSTAATAVAAVPAACLVLFGVAWALLGRSLLHLGPRPPLSSPDGP